ncbi:MAG: YceI family protein [Rhodobacterales bacterium]|nr:YceI family protein [Rhodobacterales bacterium]
MNVFVNSPAQKTLFAAALVIGAGAANIAAAAPQAYVLDASHSQVLFSYNHLGFSTTYGMFSGFDGTISFDAEDPAASTVKVSMPLKSMLTGWEARFAHFMSKDFFDAADDEMVSFTSTGIEVTGENTALITGDLEVNGITKSVVLTTTMNQMGTHPVAGKEWLGFDATTTLTRSDFGVGAFAPYVGDEVTLKISIEASKVE